MTRYCGASAVTCRSNIVRSIRYPWLNTTAAVRQRGQHRTEPRSRPAFAAGPGQPDARYDQAPIRPQNADFALPDDHERM
jgi:hypothetical protein